MKISRFFGITTREAMRQVRMALGADALIVSNRRVNGGVEILATDQTSLTEAESRAISAHVSGEASITPSQSAPAPTGAPLNRSAGMPPGAAVAGRNPAPAPSTTTT